LEIEKERAREKEGFVSCHCTQLTIPKNMKKTIETNKIIALFLYTPTCLSQGCPLSNSFVICLEGLVRFFFIMSFWRRIALESSRGLAFTRQKLKDLSDYIQSFACDPTTCKVVSCDQLLLVFLLQKFACHLNDKNCLSLITICQ
jgi:hypothetical protein